jgi:hypothetical protein
MPGSFVFKALFAALTGSSSSWSQRRLPVRLIAREFWLSRSFNSISPVQT